METKRVSNNMIERMPIYLHYIKALPENTKNISATKIASALGLGEISVRKDLAKISHGGRCRLGYDCEALIHDIETFLGVKSTMNAVVAGKGGLMQVLLHCEDFEISGLKIVAGFDMECKQKKTIDGKTVYPVEQLESVCRNEKVQIGIIMVPAENAQEVCDRLVSTGVEGIWNFTSVHLNVPKEVILQNECFTASITKFRMQFKEKNEAV